MEVTEHIELKCPQCAYRFIEADVHERIIRGEVDIGCVNCDFRINLEEAVSITRKSDLEIQKRCFALRTEVLKNVKKLAEDAQMIFTKSGINSEIERPIRILHISDLHFNAQTNIESKARQIISDIKGTNIIYKDEVKKCDNNVTNNYLHEDKHIILPKSQITRVSKSNRTNLKYGFKSVDILVISGDLVDTANPIEFEKAQQFVSLLIEALDLSAQRCIIVPGNHDLSWEENVYYWKQKRTVKEKELKNGNFKEEGNIYLIRDEKRYPKRFKNFSSYFMHPLTQSAYPLDYSEQGLVYLFRDYGIQFITFNSSWEIDEWFNKRSSINPTALARALKTADEQLGKDLNIEKNILRIGVWHHPVSGNDKIEDISFLEQLMNAKVKLILHGHVHEERADLIGYPFKQKLHVIGAGSLSADICSRPDSVPKLYNLIEIDHSHNQIKVHTRYLRKTMGAWDGWAVWPSSHPNDKKTYYQIKL